MQHLFHTRCLLGMFDEKELVAKVINGDLRAFELLVKQYQKLVFHVVNRLIDNQEDAEDICQEVFILVHKTIGKFRFESKLSTWIARIAYVTAINYLRKYRKNKTTDSQIDHFHFTDENPQNLLSKKEESNYVNMLINQMPEQYKTVLTLYHLNEFSYQEIEEITQMPEGTIKSYLFRARKLLKEKLSVYLKKELL